MRDKKFLTWIHDRLEYVHGEKHNVDYMHKLRSIIEATDDSSETECKLNANVSWWISVDDLPAMDMAMLASDGVDVYEVWFDAGGFKHPEDNGDSYFYDFMTKITHWMPLPVPPHTEV